MEGIFINHIIEQIGDGNYAKGLFNVLVFVVLYLQIKGIKTEVKAINETVTSGFKAGENRFSQIEERVSKIETHLVL